MTAINEDSHLEREEPRTALRSAAWSCSLRGRLPALGRHVEDDPIAEVDANAGATLNEDATRVCRPPTRMPADDGCPARQTEDIVFGHQFPFKGGAAYAATMQAQNVLRATAQICLSRFPSLPFLAGKLYPTRGRGRNADYEKGTGRLRQAKTGDGSSANALRWGLRKVTILTRSAPMFRRAPDRSRDRAMIWGALECGRASSAAARVLSYAAYPGRSLVEHRETWAATTLSSLSRRRQQQECTLRLLAPTRICPLAATLSRTGV
jgi:hypothetical protein